MHARLHKYKETSKQTKISKIKNKQTKKNKKTE